MAVAPIPHLYDLRRGALGLIGLVIVPLLIEWWFRHLGGHRTARTRDRQHTATSGSTVDEG
jgi:hypothetical protein